MFGETEVEVGFKSLSVLLIEELGGSGGLSRDGASESECKPTGFNGRRRVPLFACGAISKESQIMLYTSIFSVSSYAYC